jgi:hypothetical protein
MALRTGGAGGCLNAAVDNRITAETLLAVFNACDRIAVGRTSGDAGFDGE